jgi:hypothetical protein
MIAAVLPGSIVSYAAERQGLFLYRHLNHPYYR